MDQVTARLAPSNARLEAVTSWLEQYGVSLINILPSRDFIQAKMPVAVAEKLLDVTYRVYTHVKTGKTLLRATDAYSVPSNLLQHIDFISGVNHFPCRFHFTQVLTFSSP